MLQSTKIKGVGDLKSNLSSNMEIQSLEFAQMFFGIALVHFLLNISPLYNVCTVPLYGKYVIWFLIFILQGITIKRLHES